MSDSKITLIGLNKYLSYENKSLFDYLTLPDGIDKDTLCSNILQKGSEFEAQYPDAEYMRASVGMWSKKWYWTIDKWLKAINIEYSPLENYDRFESWVDKNTHKDDDTIGSTRDITAGQTTESDSTRIGENIEDSTIEHNKSAFDSGTYSPYEKSKTDSNIKESDKVTSNSKTDDTSKDEYTESRGNVGEYENTHEGRLHGNIGVTTSQQMLQSEIDIAYFSLYDRITDLFLTEFCIPIYI